MAKGVLDRINTAAKKRLKRLQAAAAEAADSLLVSRYRDTAEATLRGASAVTQLMHEENPDLDTANRLVANQLEPAKPKRKRTASKISKPGISKSRPSPSRQTPSRQTSSRPASSRAA